MAVKSVAIVGSIGEAPKVAQSKNKVFVKDINILLIRRKEDGMLVEKGKIVPEGVVGSSTSVIAGTSEFKGKISLDPGVIVFDSIVAVNGSARIKSSLIGNDQLFKGENLVLPMRG